MTTIDDETLDLGAKWGQTTLSNYEVFMVGEALFRWVNTVGRLGHATPASTLDYTTDPAQLSLGGLIVRDFVAWASGRTHLAEGCEERMRQLATNANLDGAAAASVDRFLAGGAA